MDDKKSSDFLWKIVLCGDSFVGKTTIRKRAMGEHFAEEYISTVGADFSSYKLKLGDLTIGFQVWDLAGQDKYKYIRSSFYGGATGCFLVFDVTNPKSMKNLSSWVDEAIRYSNGTIEIFVICSNKIDLKNRREISKEMGEKYAQALRESSGLQCEFIETSALTGENVDIAFDKMAKCLLEREGISPVKQKEIVDETTEASQPVISKPIPTPISMEPVEPVKTQIIETIPAPRKPIMVEEDGDLETEKLIAEVMSVLDETNEIIIGRETTSNGERAITVSKETIEQSISEDVEEEEPKISTQLESVLLQINSKLDSLTNRLKDLEEEISQVKEENGSIETETQVLEQVEDIVDELDVLAQLPIPTEQKEFERELTAEKIEPEEVTTNQPIIEEPQDDLVSQPIEQISEILPEETAKPKPIEIDDENDLDKDQQALESILDTLPISPQREEAIEEEEEEADALEETMEVFEEEEKASSNSKTDIRNLEEIPNNGLVDIPDEEPLVSIQTEDYEEIEDNRLIGTELSSAMISELKDMDGKDESRSDSLLTQPLNLEELEEKNLCPICGEEVKYIRQYKKFYCVKCGRYLI